MKNVFSKLKVEAEPFFPKNEKEKKTKLSDVDMTKVKDFYPKNYTVVSKITNAENK